MLNQTSMGQIRDSLKVFAVSAGVIGIIQGTIWLTLSIFAIVSYNICDMFEANTVTEIFWKYIQRAYFMGNECENSLYDRFDSLNLHVMRPFQMLVWMSIYLGLSALWIIASILLITGTLSRTVGTVTIMSYYLWSFLTLSISALDIAIGVLLALDYKIFEGLYNINDTNSQEYIFLTGGSSLLMTIAFRSYVFVLINIGLGFFIFIESFGLRNDNTKFKHNIHSQGPLHAYESSTAPNSPWNSRREFERPSLQPQLGQRNLAYEFTPTTSNQYERSSSWHEVKQNPQRPKVQHEPLKDSESKQRTQTQQVSAMSPRTFEPYYTPTPDYSPPPMRHNRLKPTLKHNF